MRFTPILLASMAGLAAAYDSLLVQNYNNDNNLILKYATEIPVCANLCIFQAAIAVGCETSDYHCQCSHKRLQLFSLTENCLAKSCNRDQIKRAHSLTDFICTAVAEGVQNPNFNPAPLPPPPPPPAPMPVEFPAAPVEFPAPAPVEFPAPALTEAPVMPVAPVMMRRDVPAPQFEKRASFVASFASSIAPTETTAAPTSVATAGAAVHKAPVLLAGVGAAAVAALLL